MADKVSILVDPDDVRAVAKAFGGGSAGSGYRAAARLLAALPEPAWEPDEALVQAKLRTPGPWSRDGAIAILKADRAAGIISTVEPTP